MEEAGVSREQAETHIQIVSEIMESHLATQQDMKDLRAEIRADMLQFKADVRADLQEMRKEIVLLEQRMTIKLGTIVSIAIGVAVTLARVVGKG